MAMKKTSKSSGGSSFDISSFLNKNKTKAKEALQQAKDNEGLPSFDDGRYRMKLLKMEVGKSQNGRVQVITTYKFLDGEYKKQSYKSYRGISDDKGKFNVDYFDWFLQDVKRLGYDIDELDLDDLPDLMKQVTKDKPTIIAVLRTKENDKGEFQNLMINKVVEEDDEDEDDEDEDTSKKKKGKKKKDDDEDDEDESDDDDSDDDEEDEDDEDEEDDKKKKKGKKSDDDDDDDDSEDEDEEDDDDDEDEEPKKKGKKKSSKKKDDDDDEDEDEEESDDDDSEEVPVTVGSIVKVKLKAGTQKCEVVDVLEEDNAIKVKTKEGKTVKVSADKILSVEEPPKKKKGKK